MAGTVRYALTEKEVAASVGPVLRSIYGGKRKVPLLLFLVVALINLILLKLWGLLVALAVGLIIGVIAARFAVRRHFRRDQRQRSEIEMTFTDQGVSAKTDQSRTELDWGFLRGFSETALCYFLQVAPGRLIIVPKRAFPTPELEQDFVRAARAGIPGVRK